jgi:hypothetical protein
MRKMMLLAAVVAIAALMMAATPAFAQKNAPRTEIDGFVFVPGACANLEGTTLSQAEAVALLEAAGLDPDELPDRGNVCLLAEPDDKDDDDATTAATGATATTATSAESSTAATTTTTWSRPSRSPRTSSRRPRAGT